MTRVLSSIVLCLSIFVASSLAGAVAPVPKGQLIPVKEGPMVFRHKDPNVEGFFALDCNGHAYLVTIAFRGLGFSTQSPDAPIAPDALATLITIYSNWLASDPGPQGSVRKTLVKAVAIAKGEREADEWPMTAAEKRERDAYERERRRRQQEQPPRIKHDHNSVSRPSNQGRSRMPINSVRRSGSTTYYRGLDGRVRAAVRSPTGP